MKAFPRNLLRGALLMGVAALWAQSAAADGAFTGDSNPDPVSKIDLAPPLGYLNAARNAQIDYSPVGATPGAANAVKTSEGGAPCIELTRTPAPGSEPGFTIPPASEAPNANAVVTPAEPPPAAPVAAAPVPPKAVEPETPPKAAEVPATAPVVAEPAIAVPPAVAAEPVFDISDLLRVALDGMVAQTPVPRPAGAADWKTAREAVRAFYASRQNAPVWVDAHGLNAAGRSLIARLRSARDDGLDLSGFELPERDLDGASSPRLAQVEVTLSAAAVAYALQASGGRIVPTSISPLVTAKPQVADPGKALTEIAAATDPGARLLAYNPPQKGYADLRDALARVRASAPAASRAPRGPVLKIGMIDERVPLIRARFGLGALPGPAAAETYDARVASAVASFQRTHGLAPNGALNDATVDALFADPARKREADIVANMEMWRWQPRDMGSPRIEVNVPDFMLYVMDGDSEIRSTRVIVGKPDTPTPIFSNAVRYLLVNPAWHVPESIIKKEMAPKLANDPTYLERHGFKVTYIGNHLVVEQPPGERNALGHILFMFPNEHSVYLHDTPSRGLFATPRRAYSHGCVRVEGPAELAEFVMGGAAQGWTAARVRSMVGTVEHTVSLPRPLPIHIEYFTEFVDPAGELQEREDVYGLTTRVAATISRMRQD